MKCAYCHDELAVAATCVECHTALHFECWDEHPQCPTLGCEVEVQPARSLGWVSALAFVFTVLCSLSRVDSINGPPADWECDFLGGGPRIEEEAPPRLFRKAPEWWEENKEASPKWLSVSLRERMAASPRWSEEPEREENTNCRRRVVGIRKEEESDALPTGFIGRSELHSPGDIGGGLTW